MKSGVRPKFVLFGDSITQHSFGPGGWGAALQHEYARKADVVLRGYSGYNTRWALLLLDHIFPKNGAEAPALVTVFFGANDAALPERQSKKQHVPLKEFKQNIENIVVRLQELSSSTRVILITPPPIDEEARLKYARLMYGDMAVTEPERTNETTGEYASACREVAAKLSIPIIDTWLKMQQHSDWRSFLSDGLHLSEKGNKFVFKELSSILTSSSSWSPPLVQTNMPWDFPEHTEINGEHPESSFQVQE